MDHFDEVKASFTKQSEKFSSYHMSKSEYTGYLIRKIGSSGTEHALEVAAGTCICGRALAPHVKDIVCLDLTRQMLEEGKRLAAEQGIRNISFVTANAEGLPFADESFDLVITRLSLHHFADPRLPFDEMRRVLKRGGKLAVWDMVAAAEELRGVNDSIERMRDPSHTKILSSGEFRSLFGNEFTLQTEEITPVPVRLHSWMELTGTPPETRQEIISLMRKDISGGTKTGFSPYERDGEIWFDHRWLLVTGVRK